MSKLRSHDPDFYVAKGYALLLAGLAESMKPRRDRSVVFTPGMWVWMATLEFRTAKLLVLGQNPWAPLAAGEKLLPLDAD